MLRDYLNLRKAERSDWSRYGQQKGTTDDLKAVSKAIIYLKEHELFTLEDLDAALQGMSEKSKGINAAMKKASARMKVITGIQNAVADCQTHKAVHDKYLKIGWKARQAAFAESHKDELDSFNKAFRYLKKQGVDLNVNLDSLQAEYEKLKTTHTELAGQLATAKEELQPMKDIRYWVSKVLTSEQPEVEKKPEPKHSVTEKMKFLQEQSSNQQEQKTPQQKKQKMLIDLTQHATRCSDSSGQAQEYLIARHAAVETETVLVQICLELGAPSVICSLKECFQITDCLVYPMQIICFVFLCVQFHTFQIQVASVTVAFYLRFRHKILVDDFLQSLSLYVIYCLHPGKQWCTVCGFGYGNHNLGLIRTTTSFAVMGRSANIAVIQLYNAGKQVFFVSLTHSGTNSIQ